MKEFSLAIALLVSGHMHLLNSWVDLGYPSSDQVSSYHSVTVTADGTEVYNTGGNFWALNIDRYPQIKAVWGDTNSAPNWYAELATLTSPTTALVSLHEDGFLSTSTPTIKLGWWQLDSVQWFREYDNSNQPTANYANREGWEKSSVGLSAIGYGF